ncbi:hypothetical protein ACTWQF_15680 [Streptomyces sp. 8N114]|uniref:hypothetical protein n=1 Tax=Streptomyces sp. 8N114 TaxID=3457419 RepID=UPI003FD29945
MSGTVRPFSSGFRADNTETAEFLLSLLSAIDSLFCRPGIGRSALSAVRLRKRENGMKVRNSLAALGMSAVLALGVGGAVAPAAHAVTPTTTAAGVAANADYSAKDLKSGGKQSGKASPAGEAGEEEPPARSSLRCWSPYLSGRVFAVSCSGRAFRVFVDCSNRVRYVTPVLSGSKRVTLVCPAGTRALRGGAFGR